MKSPKHYAAAVSSFIIWGFMSFGLRPLQAYPSLDILFYRVFFCVGFMVILNFIFRRKVLVENFRLVKTMESASRKKLLWLTLASSMLITSNWFLFIYVMNHISINTASFAYLVCPIITTVFAFLILKEKLTRMQWLAVVLSVFSCALLSIGHILDIFYSLVIASTYALYLITQKGIGPVDRFVLLSVQMVISACVLLPFFPFFSGPVPEEGKFYIYVIIIAIVFTILPLFLNLYALKKIGSSTVGIFIYINPLINFFLAFFYYKEIITFYQVIAYSVILLSIVIFNLKNLAPKKEVAPPAKGNIA